MGGPSLEDLKRATPRQIPYQSVFDGYRSAMHHRQLVCGLGASQSPQCCLLTRSKERRRYCYRKVMLVHTSNLQWYTLYSLSRRGHRRYDNWWREKYCSCSYYRPLIVLKFQVIGRTAIEWCWVLNVINVGAGNVSITSTPLNTVAEQPGILSADLPLAAEVTRL